MIEKIKKQRRAVLELFGVIFDIKFTVGQGHSRQVHFVIYFKGILPTVSDPNSKVGPEFGFETRTRAPDSDSA